MTNVSMYDSDVVFDTDEAYNPVGVPTSAVAFPSITHLSVPLVLQGDGTFRTVLQNTIDEVAQNVEVICGSVQGERSVVPTFGLEMTNFLTPNPTDIQAAVTEWEPRASVQVTVTASDSGVANVNVGVTLNQGTQ